MAATNALLQIRRSLETHVGQQIRLRAHRGRRKTLEKVGVLENTYPSIFVVRIDEPNYNQRLSFSYADVLTETVELTLMQKARESKTKNLA
ncbi:Veg family protein [Dethiobacter alkaliphilus]|nr:Veg family protein [Dethiobacter alkaliphilus]